MGRKVVVGMSGGVDSAVAALKLLEAGYEVVGLFMKNWDEDDGSELCTALRDLEDAQKVCDRLGIPLHRVNFAAEYWEEVFEEFLREHEAGRTPNPDVLCNRQIKFHHFLDYALELGGERIATGHYCRLRERGGQVQLLRGVDPEKDQSYFLCMVPQEALQKSLFPIGHLRKREVREIARKAGLPNAEKRDSTGVCFIGERRFRQFLQRYLEPRPGPILTPEGERLGEHLGLMFYTIGQRKGLGIGGVKGRSCRWYVAEKDFERNALIVVPDHDHPLLMKRGLVAGRLHWIAGEPPAEVFRCTAKHRYRTPDQPCRVEVRGERALVVFDRPQRALTEGQVVVFYDGEVCLGGGVIEEVLKE